MAALEINHRTRPPAPLPAIIAPNRPATKIRDRTRPGRSAVTLDLPEIAENGNSVPITVKVTSPMTEQLYVARIVIIAEANPTPTAATFSLTPLSGRAEVSTRIRLAQTQTVSAIAEMSDGSIEMDKKTVKVTAGGCGG
ncbi:thiosulfate oxidation carrier protein SoxY (plasmid) [Methylosinus trichosporium OB3b]|uniref:Thiosulfate oxidation carrier protein SoxY n=1 Tax=Methylosinus trichosporium (strain ATCC 35070 / NCIMB 11131 / UNIQEM 75 / OB3b) TaxID=595536 RepID=A0A2D2D6J4_METT3|nr:thiosulfate oxidation carrier protein SoxY [Methylosinus trichosporium OB3b]